MHVTEGLPSTGFLGSPRVCAGCQESSGGRKSQRDIRLKLPILNHCHLQKLGFYVLQPVLGRGPVSHSVVCSMGVVGELVGSHAPARPEGHWRCALEEWLGKE